MSSLRRPQLPSWLRRLSQATSPDSELPASSGFLAALSPLQRGMVEACWAALGSAVVFAMVVLVAWLAGAAGAGSGMATAKFALDSWLFAHGVPLVIKGESISLIPWLATLIPFGALVWAARRLVGYLPDSSDERPTSTGARRDVVSSGGGFVAMYVTLAVLAAIVARTDDIWASLLWAPVTTAFWAALAYVWSLSRRFPGELGELFPRVGWYWRVDVPGWAKQILRPALRGTGVLFALGAVAVVVVVALNLPRIGVVGSYVDPGRVGGVVFTLLQLAYLPTLATWAVGFAAGPGFSIGEGTLITWGNATVGPVPLIPVLGAIPDPGPLPAATLASVLVPIVVGAWVAFSALRRVGPNLPVVGSRDPGKADTPPTSGRPLFWSRLLIACSAAATSAVATAVLCGFAEGSLGGQRLANVGVQPFAVGAALLLEMLSGAFVVVCLSMLRRAKLTPVTDLTDSTDSAEATNPAKR